MKFLLLISFFFLFPHFLKAQDAFEGIITYKVTTTVKNENSPYFEYYSQKWGDSLRIKFAKDGSFKREYIGDGTMGFEWHIYDRHSNTYYAKWKGIDTIYYYDCSIMFSELKDFREVESSEILGKPCKAVIVSTFEPASQEYMTYTYHYNGDPKVNSSTFSDIKDGFLDRVYRISGSHILKYEIDQSPVYVLIEAISVKAEKIDSVELEIPESIPWKKW